MAENSGMSVEDSKKIREEWTRQEHFQCRRCSAPAYVDPKDHGFWGCPECGFATWAIPIYFRETSGSEAKPKDPPAGFVHQKYPPGTTHRDSEFGLIRIG